MNNNQALQKRVKVSPVLIALLPYIKVRFITPKNMENAVSTIVQFLTSVANTAKLGISKKYSAIIKNPTAAAITIGISRLLIHDITYPPT
jgi:hypothetical protein